MQTWGAESKVLTVLSIGRTRYTFDLPKKKRLLIYTSRKPSRKGESVWLISRKQ